MFEDNEIMTKWFGFKVVVLQIKNVFSNVISLRQLDSNIVYVMD